MLLRPLSLALAVCGHAGDVQSLPGKPPTPCSRSPTSSSFMPDAQGPAVLLVQTSVAARESQFQPVGAAVRKVPQQRPNRTSNATSMVMMTSDEVASMDSLAMGGIIGLGAICLLICFLVLSGELDFFDFDDDKPRAGPGRRQAAPRRMEGPSLRNAPARAPPPQQHPQPHRQPFLASGGPSPVAADLPSSERHLSHVPSAQRSGQQSRDERQASSLGLGHPAGNVMSENRMSAPRSSKPSSRGSLIGGGYSSIGSLSDIVVLNSGAVDRPPPALCPALVLPHCESWFAVSFEQLMNGETFDMIGLSGRPLLRATLQQPSGTGNVRFVGIGMLGKSSSILGSCQTSERHGILELRGQRGEAFGTLAQSTPGRWTLSHNGQPALNLAYDTQVGQLIVSASDGAVIGSAKRRLDSEFFSSSEHLEVRVGPTIDSILVLCCILGVLLFGGQSGGPLSLDRLT